MTTLREAAQMALKALEYYKHRNLEWDYADEHAIESLRAALAQPIKPDYSKAGFGQPEQEPPCKTGSQCIGNKCERCAQPEREWQGLTDEERAFLAWESENGPDCVEMTEFKLWEKNR